MSKVIRVDNEVFEALQQQAVPLVDSPNDVLRRVLGLDQKENAVQARARSSSSRSARSDSGKRINKRYNLNAEHPLYHIDGTFYERLRRFPGFLADPGGYVWYATEAEFENDPNLDIQAKVHVRSGVSQHPRYQVFPEAVVES